MSDPASNAARALSQARWGNRKPTRLSDELVRRAGELDPASRQRLLEALTAATPAEDFAAWLDGQLAAKLPHVLVARDSSAHAAPPDGPAADFARFLNDKLGTPEDPGASS